MVKILDCKKVDRNLLNDFLARLDQQEKSIAAVRKVLETAIISCKIKRAPRDAGIFFTEGSYGVLKQDVAALEATTKGTNRAAVKAIKTIKKSLVGVGETN